METFLETTRTQRARYLQLHKEMHAESIFSEADMKELLRNWMSDYKSRMGTDKKGTSTRNCSAALTWELACELIRCDEVRSLASCSMSLATRIFFVLASSSRFTVLCCL